MPIIGLDLGKHKFIGAEMEREKGAISLVRYGQVEDARLNFDVESKEDLIAYAKNLRNFVAEFGFKTNEVVVSLPETHVFMRVIKVPEMSDKDMITSIPIEAEQYIPLTLKETNLSFQKIDPDLDDKGKMNILLVAAKKTILEKYVFMLKEARLVPHAIEPETISLGRILGDTPDKPVATVIVNIGVENTTIIITYRGYVRFTRTVSIGAEILTKTLAQKLNLEYPQAEEYKKAYGLDQTQAEGKVYEALKPTFDLLIMEIKRGMMFFSSHNANVPLTRIVLGGGTALMPGVLLYFATNIDGEVELANPWKNVLLSNKLEKDREFLLSHAPIFSTAVGLALKDVL